MEGLSGVVRNRTGGIAPTWATTPWYPADIPAGAPDGELLLTGRSL